MKLSEVCLAGAGILSGRYLDGVFRVSGGCLEIIYGPSKCCVECLDVSEGQVRTGQVRTG